MAYQSSEQVRKQIFALSAKVLAKHRNVWDAKRALGNGIIRMPKADLVRLADELGLTGLVEARKWELTRDLTAWFVRNIWAA